MIEPTIQRTLWKPYSSYKSISALNNQYLIVVKDAITICIVGRDAIYMGRREETEFAAGKERARRKEENTVSSG